ncbi:hypothetical protein [Coleofasciculus sp.]|uniref:hypothetical protein n=1 Tax=Coleofasciculus sp. TaxID=3100458 RepID=UPI0039F74C6A
MPSKTFIVRAHARTIYTRPVTFICAKCHQATTRECYPGTPPKYCLNCAPRKKKASATRKPEKGMFKPTHHLVAQSTGERTPVCLETSSVPGCFWVRTALDWFAGESIIQYHKQKGLYSRDMPLVGYSLDEIASDIGTGNSKQEQGAIATASPPQTRPHSARELCKRFKCGDRLLKRMRSAPDFEQWSQSRDPLGIAWVYRDEKFLPKMQDVEPEFVSPG